ncbi:hypothetical protein N478_22450 [Pseudoalteromonas luteoviolacea S4060-1]|uniref:Uncharacterized protein n=1 Tax=Pseudoalteromonas luteoviolacea S4060-1 TaxID=1365257 RepID=A0A167LAV0_9GAMM|nr:hypothetical protein N478_22450 [Pseudoalteromonas luteoviolacea S4060-1]
MFAGYYFWRKIKKKVEAEEVEVTLQWKISEIEILYVTLAFIAIVSSKLMYDA